MVLRQIPPSPGASLLFTVHSFIHSVWVECPPPCPTLSRMPAPCGEAASGIPESTCRPHLALVTHGGGWRASIAWSSDGGKLHLHVESKDRGTPLNRACLPWATQCMNSELWGKGRACRSPESVRSLDKVGECSRAGCGERSCPRSRPRS